MVASEDYSDATIKRLKKSLGSKMGYASKFKRQKAYTLLEITITVIILGVLASLALPNFSRVIERSRVGEGYQILDALYKAQRAFSFENNGNFTGTMSNLDVSVPVPAYFQAPTVSAVDPIASIDRGVAPGRLYTLRINPTGIITCNAGTMTCAQIGCGKGAGGNQCN